MESSPFAGLFDTAEEAGAQPASAPALPTSPYHDFTKGKPLTIVESWADLKPVVDYFTNKIELARQQQALPLLIAVDTETTAVERIIKKYTEAQADLTTAKAVFDQISADRTSGQKAQTWTDPDEQRFVAARDTLGDHRKKVNDLAKEVQKAGLNVHAGQVRLVQLYDGNRIVVVDRWKLSRSDWDQLGKLILCHPDVEWVCHNAYFDRKMLAQHGVEPVRHTHCTQLQSHALTPLSSQRKSLAHRCKTVLGKELAKELQASDWARPVLDPAQVRYAAGDVVATYELFFAQQDLLQKHQPCPEANAPEVYNLLRRTIPAVTQMHLTGIGFDRIEHGKVAQDLEQRSTDLETRVIAAFRQCSDPGAPIVDNPGSNVQIAAWLNYHLYQGNHTVGQPQWPTTPTGQLACGREDILVNLSQIGEPYQPALQLFCEWKKVAKANDTLGEKFSRWVNTNTNRIHAHIRIGTETLRYSIADPALQVIDRSSTYRRMFVAQPGRKLVVCDYGQIQLRIAGCLSGDPVMLAAFEEGADPHSMGAMAAFRMEQHVASYLGSRLSTERILDLAKNPEIIEWFKKKQGKPFRQAAKTTNFCTLFGGGPGAIAGQLREEGVAVSRQEARRIQGAVLGEFPVLEDWLQNTRDRAMGKAGNPIAGTPDTDGDGLCWSPFGHVYYPEHNSSLYTKSVNTPIQGGEAEIILYLLSLFPQAWGSLDAKLALVVHDELIADAAEADAEAARQTMMNTMARAAVTLFPNMPRRDLVEGGIGDNWAEAK